MLRPCRVSAGLRGSLPRRDLLLNAAALARQAGAEMMGTGLLVAVIVGSGIAAQRLSPGDAGLQLLENSAATALGLAVLILVLQPLSGAHLNPLVSLVDRLLDTARPAAAVAIFAVAQVVGGIGGALLANAMFGVPTALSSHDRVDAGTALAEVVATAGLVLVVFALARTGRAAVIGPAVGAYIGAAYWFTSSTAFANPAVAIARVFTGTFAGIAPLSALCFVVAEFVGAAAGAVLVLLLFPRRLFPRKAMP